VRRGGTAVIVGPGRWTPWSSSTPSSCSSQEKKLLGSLLGLGRRPHRVRPPHPALEGRRLDLEGMITARMDISKAQDAFDAMKRGETIRQILTF